MGCLCEVVHGCLPVCVQTWEPPGEEQLRGVSSPRVFNPGVPALNPLSVPRAVTPPFCKLCAICQVILVMAILVPFQSFPDCSTAKPMVPCYQSLFLPLISVVTFCCPGLVLSPVGQEIDMASLSGTALLALPRVPHLSPPLVTGMWKAGL